MDEYYLHEIPVVLLTNESLQSLHQKILFAHSIQEHMD